MYSVKVRAGFRVSIPAELRKEINLREGDIMEVVRVDEGILFRVNQRVDRQAIADRIASEFAKMPVLSEDAGRSEEEIMNDVIAEISAARQERRKFKNESRVG